MAAELGGRDAQQVKHHFLYVQNQNLRKGPWTLIPKAGGLRPQAVAAELGGRDAQQVKHHFLYVQNQNLRKGPWTKEEDAALLKARLFVNFRDHVPQVSVILAWWAASPAIPCPHACLLLARSAKLVCQALSIVTCVISIICDMLVGITQASRCGWTNLLFHAQSKPTSVPVQSVAVHGPRKWAAIAPAVPHRSDQQCRERWLNVLDPSLRLCAWEPGEDAALRGAVAACTKPDGKIGCAQAKPLGAVAPRRHRVGYSLLGFHYRDRHEHLWLYMCLWVAAETDTLASLQSCERLCSERI